MISVELIQEGGDPYDVLLQFFTPSIPCIGELIHCGEYKKPPQNFQVRQVEHYIRRQDPKKETWTFNGVVLTVRKVSE